MSATLDTSRFKSTLARYALQSSRTMREVINHTALNLSMESMKETRRANRADIQRIGTDADPNKLIWYKYIAKLLSKTGFVTKRHKFRTDIINGKRKRVRISTQESVISGSYTKAQAQEVSRQLKARKLRGIGYIAVGWLPAVQYFWNKVKDKAYIRQGRPPKQFGGPKGRGYESGSTWNPAAHVENRTDAAGKIAGPAYKRALFKVGVDMVQHMREKMQKAALKARRNGV